MVLGSGQGGQRSAFHARTCLVSPQRPLRHRQSRTKSQLLLRSLGARRQYAGLPIRIAERLDLRHHRASVWRPEYRRHAWVHRPRRIARRGGVEGYASDRQRNGNDAARLVKSEHRGSEMRARHPAGRSLPANGREPEHLPLRDMQAMHRSRCAVHARSVAGLL